MLKQTFKMTAIAVWVGLAVTACSSSGDHDNRTSTTPNSTQNTTQPEVNTTPANTAETKAAQEASDKAKAAQQAAEKAKAEAEAKAKALQEAQAKVNAETDVNAKAEAEKKLQEAKAAAEKAEQERIAKEDAAKKSEQDRIAKENAAKKAEQDRLAKEKAEQEKRAKEQAEKEKAEKEKLAQEQPNKPTELTRAQIEKNDRSDKKWRVLLFSNISDPNRAIYKIPQSWFTDPHSYRHFYTEDGYVLFHSQPTPNIDVSHYEINPQKIQHVAKEDNPDPTNLDIIFVNQKYSSYAVWDNSPVFTNKDFSKATYREGMAVGTTAVAKNATRPNNKIAYSGEYLAPQSSDIVTKGQTAVYQGNVLSSRNRYKKEDYDLHKNTYPDVPQDRKIGNIELVADFGKQNISGKITSYDTKKMDNAILQDTKIEHKSDTIRFSGKIIADNQTLRNKQSFADFLSGNLNDEGQYYGTFVGPNAEEILGGGEYKNYSENPTNGNRYYPLKNRHDFIFGATREGNYSYPAEKK
ncbi:transferrin-binding protein-like solute binding protein [Lonepinella sp. BR2474]|uniref:transferrin-binding protein-like solute binding protein n=1 Tax=Lonepinella sp. BR2474 TaxID=3434548 RepID=UPI003F6E1387